MPSPSPQKGFPKFFISLFVIFIVLMAAKPFIEFDKGGTPRLATWRKQKMQKEIDDLDEAEQYVLLAGVSGLYPCYSCQNASTIQLNKGDIWKYGVTTKGKFGRYGNKLERLNLQYIPQFRGTLENCLKEERRKIYQYALLPENLARQTPIIRPPGNKKDS